MHGVVHVLPAEVVGLQLNHHSNKRESSVSLLKLIKFLAAILLAPVKGGSLITSCASTPKQPLHAIEKTDTGLQHHSLLILPWVPVDGLTQSPAQRLVTGVTRTSGRRILPGDEVHRHALHDAGIQLCTSALRPKRPHRFERLER